MDVPAERVILRERKRGGEKFFWALRRMKLPLGQRETSNIQHRTLNIEWGALFPWVLVRPPFAIWHDWARLKYK